MAMDNRTREIRQVLLGRTVWTQDGFLKVRQKGQHMGFQGVGNGWAAVRFLGISHRERLYRLPANAPKKLTEELLYRMGRPLQLEEQPKAVACLCRYLMSAPVLLIAEREENLLRVSAYTARGLLSPLAHLRTLNSFEKGLPETVKPVEERQRTRREDKHRQRKNNPKKNGKKGGKRLDKGGTHQKKRN